MNIHAGVPGTPFDGVEEEILQEKARGLGRTGQRLARILEELAGLRQHLAAAPTLDPVAVDRHAVLRAEAIRLCQMLIIQREACGFRRHPEVARQYPIPPAWRPA